MIFEKTLPNGLELIVYPTSAPVASVHVWVDVGSIDEKSEEAGYCHFLEHMLFKGTKKRTTGQIAGAIEGAGGEMNAFTSFEYTAYHITLSNTQWALANDILADMVLGSIFKVSEFNPEKEVILEEIKRGEDSPDRRLYQSLYNMWWGASSFGRPIIGYPKTVSKCTAGGLKKFWQKWYAPSLMTVVITGNVDPAQVEAHVAKTWGKAKNKALRKRRRQAGFKSEFIKNTSIRQSMPFPVQSIRWCAGFPAVSLFDEKLPALDVASSVIGSGETSRLHQKLYREKNEVVSVGCSVWAPLAEGLFTFDAETPLEKGGGFRKTLFQELERFAEEGPTAEELERAKVNLESERIYGSQSMESLAYRLGYLKTSMGNVQFDLEYLSQVRELTKEDVRLTFQQALNAREFREFALFPKDYTGANFWEYQNKFTAVPAPAPVKKSAVSQKPLVKKNPLEGHHIKLNNGIDLILFEKHELPVVHVHSCVLGGLRAEDKSQAGIGSLMAELWEKGPQGWSAEHTSKFLESRASRVSAFSGRNSTGLSATTMTKHLDDILPLFSDVLFSPAFEEKEFSREKKVQLEDIKTFDDSPGRLVDKLFCEAIFEGHPYSMPIVGYEDTIKNMSLENIKNHYQSLVKKSRVVISVAGKFNADKVSRYFEKIQRDAVAQFDQKNIPYDRPKANRVSEITKNREQSHLIYGFSGLSLKDSDRAHLKVLTTILGGQSGRLFRELRDKKGLCYVVAPMSFEGIESGYVGVYMGCDPKKRFDALKGIANELTRLTEKPITPVEITRAKEFLSGRHHMDLQMGSALASTSALNVLYGLNANEHLRLNEELKTVNAKTLKKLAEKLFNKPSVTAIVI